MIAALDGAEPVRAVRAALGGHDGWIVGGAVRDAVLGRAVTDVDVAVAGDPERVARELAQALRGPVFALSETFGAWRVLARRQGFTVDVSALQGDTIEADLARRDFTVNAIAVPLAGGEPIDPLGGLADLGAATLRVLGPDAYARDPLRPLRLVRFTAELGMTPDRDTERLTRAAAARLSEPAAERVFAELRGTVAAPGVLGAFDLAARVGVLDAVLPELTALRGIEQSRFHHLDVYDHTLAVLDRLVALQGDLGAVFGSAAGPVAAVLDEPLADGLTRGQALRFGALLHDIAKPQTRGVAPDGRVTFVGHDAVGEQLARAILTRLRAGERLAGHVGALVRHHLALGFLVHHAPLDAGDRFDYLDAAGPVGVDVTVLSCADRMATRGEGQPPWIERHLALAAELMPAALAWHGDGPPRPPIRGDELAAALGIERGPELGELLAQLRRAAYTGAAPDRDAAIAFARRALQER